MAKRKFAVALGVTRRSFLCVSLAYFNSAVISPAFSLFPFLPLSIVRVAGIHVTSGSIYVVVADLDATCVSGIKVLASQVDPISTNGEELTGPVLRQVLARLTQDLRSAAVERVGVLHTRQHANWKYSSAALRAGLVTVALIAADVVGAVSMIVRTEDAGRVVAHRPDKLNAVDAAKFGADSLPKYWTAGRSQAAVAAAAAAALD